MEGREWGFRGVEREKSGNRGGEGRVGREWVERRVCGWGGGEGGLQGDGHDRSGDGSWLHEPERQCAVPSSRHPLPSLAPLLPTFSLPASPLVSTRIHLTPTRSFAPPPSVAPPGRRRDCHCAAPASTFSRSFNVSLGGVEVVSSTEYMDCSVFSSTSRRPPHQITCQPYLGFEHRGRFRFAF